MQSNKSSYSSCIMMQEMTPRREPPKNGGPRAVIRRDSHLAR